MMRKITRIACQQGFPVLPELGYDPVADEELIRFPEVSSSGVFVLPAPSFSRFAIRFGATLARTMRVLGVDELIFLGDNDIPWRRRAMTFPPAARGLLFLEDAGIGKGFNGGLAVPPDELPIFMRHLVWLVRTNGILPGVWFTDPAQRFIASPCQYGGLHFSILHENDESLIRTAFGSNRFVAATAAECDGRFILGDRSVAGGIPGRSIVV